MFVTSITKPIKIAVFSTSILLLVTLANTPSVRAAPTGTLRYVVTTGSDTGNNCATPGSPCASIQRAVNQSTSGDEIRVAAGTYFYNSSEDIPCSFLETRPVVCVLDKELWIRGGFTASNWNSYNPSINVTTIDGSSARRGVYVFWYTIQTSLIMEGFTIQNCRVVGPSYGGIDPTGFGGGMWTIYADVTLRDIKFLNNVAIGQANPPNYNGRGGTGAGAGMAIVSGQEVRISSALLQRVTFDSNQSQGATGSVRGGIAFGALFVNSSTVTIEDSTFTNNSAVGGDSSGSGIDFLNNQAYALGAAIGAEQASLTLNRITVTGNHGTGGGNIGAQGGGGHGGGILSEDGTSFSLVDSTIKNNSITAGNGTNGGYSFGGGISLIRTSGTIDRTYIISNTARAGNSTGGGSAGGPGGGGVYTVSGAGGTATLTNVIIADNSAIGGTSGTNPGGGGGGIQIQGVNATLTHVTFALNSLGPNLVSGQAILLLTSATATVNDNIIANHTRGGAGASAVLVQTGNTITFNRGLYAGNTKNDNSDGSPSPFGTYNNLGSVQTNSTAGFISIVPPNYDFHLASNAFAREKATGSTTNIDIDGQPRPYSTNRDYGGDEYFMTFTPTNFLYLPFVIK